MKALDEIPASDIPEVADLLAFYERNKNELERLRTLEEEKNTLMQAAEKAVRARDVSCGPFSLVRRSIRVDWEQLYEKLGEKTFQELGGSVNTQYKGSSVLFMDRVARKNIPPDVVHEVCKSISVYKLERGI